MKPMSTLVLSCSSALMRYGCVAVLCLFAHSVAGNDLMQQFIDPLDGKFDSSQFLAENAFGFLPVPIVITDPAVQGGLGVMGLFFHESEQEAQARKKAMQGDSPARHLAPPSLSAIGGGATGNDSYFAGGGHMGFFRNGNIRYLGGLGYANVNLAFYGAGDIQFPRGIELNTEAVGIYQKLLFRIGDSKWYVGPMQRYTNASISPELGVALPERFIPNDRLDDFRNIINLDVKVSALGLGAEYDSRNNIFAPSQGYRLQLRHFWFDDGIGSDINYRLWQGQLTGYWQLSAKWQFGLNGMTEYANTDEVLPPFATPTVRFRGIPAGRYQGNAIASVEAELSYKLNTRWWLKIFGGAGRVASSYSNLSDAQSQVASGGGFRYLIARRYGFQMGIDLARGPEETVWYIQAGSTW